MTDTGREPAGSARLGTVLQLLRADAPAEIASAPHAWPRWSVLLPHVLAAAEHFGGLAPQQPSMRSEDMSWLLDRAASYLRVLGQAAEARPLAERALAITETVHGPDHPDVATRLNNLALILQDLGQAAEARPLVERALAITETTYGPDHPRVATLQSNLAVILLDLGKR
jgi:tetratricopeptide (TPR) repeat protein